ncbi:HAMP domain-containing sensor histidine kinase [uncultured Bacteroides sp.]|jgi:two-component system phosphate regulon sensor histidine kinase PhoR|uniref:sensor histidine kinase n=2 Tax=Bacteroides TaxID=816 RepID=UPI0025FC1B06|nr:HAMP domain-containing sensor histidine kinase [uncultured Bacteroides sp.]
MNNRTYIYWFTTLGVVSIFALQSIWLRNTYMLIGNEINKECSSILNRATLRGIDLASKNMPEGAEIVGSPSNDSIALVTFLCDGLWKLGVQFSISEIDSIAGVLLKNANIDSDYLVYTVNPKTKAISESSKDLAIPRFGAIKSEIIPTRLDLSQGVQLVLSNPYNTIFERMGLLMIATALMMAFVVGCIIYQINIVVRMKRIFQVREDFSYAMIHDMKTPLSTIMMSLGFLHNPKIEEKPELKSKYFKIAESETDHLLSLTNKVLTLSKLENHKLEMNKKKVSLTLMIEKLSEKFVAKSTKPVHFTTNLQVEEVYADEEYLEEAISNLIDNAIKYSKETVEIKVSSLNESPYTIIKVYDEGLGIPEKDQRAIFNKYERSAAAKRSRKGGATGFGLGLNFVYQVVEAHEGRIFVNSIEGEFSEFFIYLPQIINKL